jgi:hypothetical protein
MLSESQTHTYPLFSAGVDWITCTAVTGAGVRRLDAWWAGFVKDQRAAEGTLSAARSLNYVGYRMDHAFFGLSDQGCMVQCGGPVAAYAAKHLIAISEKITRLDLQATVFCEHAAFDLVESHWQELERNRRVEGRPFAYERRVARPTGDMLTINRRVSDVYFRLYDKGAQMQSLPKHRLWRYEGEFKRRAAERWSRTLMLDGSESRVATTAVLSILRAKNLEARIRLDKGRLADEAELPDVTRDVRRWFRDSLRVTLASAVKQYGRDAIAADLNLWKIFDGGPNNHGCLSDSHSPVEIRVDAEAARSGMSECLPLPEQRGACKR